MTASQANKPNASLLARRHLTAQTDTNLPPSPTRHPPEPEERVSAVHSGVSETHLTRMWRMQVFWVSLAVQIFGSVFYGLFATCLLYTSPSPRDRG
eukprot:2076369-Rhodomonas_salina.1